MSSPTSRFKSRRLIAPWFVLVIVLGAILATPAAAAQNGVLELTVTGPGNAPLADAQVKVGGQSAFTGSKGFTRFELAPGRYVVIVSKRGFHEGRMTVTVRPGETHPARIHLSS